MVKPEEIQVLEEIRSIFCLKIREDMTRIEEEEDCFILDFNPFEQIQLVKLSFDPTQDDTDLAVVAEKRGEVACIDYPHPRHVCAKYPFEKTSHEKYCAQCYCIVCNKPAPCEQWKEPLKHCSATHRIDLKLKTAPRGGGIRGAGVGVIRSTIISTGN